MKIPTVKVSYRNTCQKKDRFKINNSQNSFDVLSLYWDKDTIELKESFVLIALNRANEVLGIAEISNGGVSGTIVDLKIVFSIAVAGLASAIIIAHNHPSGNIKPSQADFDITEKIKKGADILDITLLDHLILTPQGEYYSFADNGNI